MVLADCFVEAREDPAAAAADGDAGDGAGDGDGERKARADAPVADATVIAGPPGSGRTSCLFQAAARYSLQGEQALLILSNKDKVYKRRPQLRKEYPRAVLSRITIRYLSPQELLTYLAYCHFEPARFAFVAIDDFDVFLQPPGEMARNARLCAYLLHMQKFMRCNLALSMPCTNLRKPERDPHMALLLRWIPHVMLIEASYRSGVAPTMPTPGDHLRSEATLYRCDPVDPFADNAAGDGNGSGDGDGDVAGVEKQQQPLAKRSKHSAAGTADDGGDKDRFLRSQIPHSQAKSSSSSASSSQQQQQHALKWTPISQTVVFTFTTRRMNVMHVG